MEHHDTDQYGEHVTAPWDVLPPELSWVDEYDDYGNHECNEVHRRADGQFVTCDFHPDGQRPHGVI